ncbi:MAG TPA: hypothetical protein PL187_20065 [Caldilinea sp.]|nr:hypothetical protein [Caldilinea sp.]
MDVTPRQIELSIDELVIDEAITGKLSPRARQSLHDEVARELTRLLGAGELPARLQQAAQIDQLTGSQARTDRNTGSGRSLGATIAQSVYRSLGA